jgi:energy-coupling factor transporter ATP-binding protein EcfA2
VTAENPFSTCHIRPGAIPFFFPPGQSAEQLVESLRVENWWGEIVGPHGSGKSTLLCALIPALRNAGRDPLLIELHDGQRRLPVDLRRTDGLTENTVVIVDGYEQLSLWSRARLKRFCRRRGLGLVVTSHQPAGMPLLFQTAPSVTLTEELVRFLLHGQPALVDSSDLAQRFDRHRGDLREVLFELYDLYEQRPVGNDGSDGL